MPKFFSDYRGGASVEPAIANQYRALLKRLELPVPVADT